MIEPWLGSDLPRVNAAAMLRIGERLSRRIGAENKVYIDIRVEGDNLVLRDWASYLRLADGAYGRSDPNGFRSYSLRQQDQIRVSAISPGSTVIELALRVFNEFDIWRTLLVYLVLRTGPSVLKGEAAKNWAEGAKALGEATLVWTDVADRFSSRREERPVRLSRRETATIRRIIKNETLLEGLQGRDLAVLVRMVGEILIREDRHLRGAARFDAGQVIGVALRLKRDDASGARDPE